MARVCLPKAERDRMIQALKSKELSIADMYRMTSEERHASFAKYLPENQARIVNATFEQAMLSNQKRSLKNWVESTVKAKEPIRKDMLKRVERINKVLSTAEQDNFLKDLAGVKLGIAVTEEESKTILALKRFIDEAKVHVNPNSPIGSTDRLTYGLAVRKFENYVGGLKLDAETMSLADRAKLSNFFKNVVDAASASKALRATLDVSFIGRQGIKLLYSGEYKLWFSSLKTLLKTFGDEMVAKSPGLFKDRDNAVMDMIYADIYSRPNAISGKYNAAKNRYGLGLRFEEALPSSAPEKLPFLGRFFKASESAFAGTAAKMRADLADAVIAAAEQNGVDMLDEAQATAFGKIVSSLTGRGGLGKAESVGRELNAILFSPKFLMANFNTLTAHFFDKSLTPEARKFAVQKTVRIIASIGAVLVTAKMLNPDSVELDPRSSKFGKIKVGNKWVDITGGMSGMVVLASRMFSFHDGKPGSWTKSSTTGKWVNTFDNSFGQQNTLDTVEQFFEGKLSPAGGVLRDFLKGQTYSGDKPTFSNTILTLGVPISAQTLATELSHGGTDLTTTMLSEGFGLSASDYTISPQSKGFVALENKIGSARYYTELHTLTNNFNTKLKNLKNSASFKRASNDDKNKQIEKLKQQEMSRILSKYGI
jgi:hypothetical protein